MTNMMKKLLVIAIILLNAFHIQAQVAEKASDIKPLLIGESLPDVSIISTEGNSEKLPAITAGKPSVLLFYRGGWCPYCNRHLSDIRTVEDQILHLGYQIIAISPDSPEKLSVTIEKDTLKYRLYSDGSGELTKAMGIAFKAPERSLGMLLDYSAGQNPGFLPVPSVFIINSEGNIIFEYVNPNYKVRLSGKLLLAVLENL
jgi:peroxiredoxin